MSEPLRPGWADDYGRKLAAGQVAAYGRGLSPEKQALIEKRAAGARAHHARKRAERAKAAR